MRDLLVTLIIFGSLPYILARPYLGILMWSWISYMNPHRLSWGFAYSMPFAQIVAIVLLVSILITKEKKSFPITPFTITWLLFLFWLTLSTLLAYFPDAAWELYVRVMKIQLITILTVVLITDLKRIRMLIWVIVGSIGFFAMKGGLFTLMTGGEYRTWGPPGSYIEGNNELAVATLMVIPLVLYLRTTVTQRWLRLGLLAAIPLGLVSALGSQSRGALVAMAAMVGFMWLKTGQKVVTGIAVAAVITIWLGLAPQSWFDRMDTINTYEADASAMGRINSWHYAINIANDRLFGGGMNSWSLETFALYAPVPDDVHVAHSIYFAVLADSGWVGLILFVALLVMSWRNGSYVIRLCRQRPNLTELATLARMCQTSLVAYMAGGAFLSLEYFDLPWHIMAILFILRSIATRSARAPAMGHVARQPLASTATA